jgi:hypothetical protein
MNLCKISLGSSKVSTEIDDLRLKLQGIWSGLIGGTAVQTLVLAYLTARCDWDEEVSHLLSPYYRKLLK